MADASHEEARIEEYLVKYKIIGIVRYHASHDWPIMMIVWHLQMVKSQI